jgi:hypothetical protein
MLPRVLFLFAGEVAFAACMGVFDPCKLDTDPRCAVVLSEAFFFCWCCAAWCFCARSFWIFFVISLDSLSRSWALSIAMRSAAMLAPKCVSGSGEERASEEGWESSALEGTAGGPVGEIRGELVAASVAFSVSPSPVIDALSPFPIALLDGPGLAYFAACLLGPSSGKKLPLFLTREERWDAPGGELLSSRESERRPVLDGERLSSRASGMFEPEALEGAPGDIGDCCLLPPSSSPVPTPLLTLLLFEFAPSLPSLSFSSGTLVCWSREEARPRWGAPEEEEERMREEENFSGEFFADASVDSSPVAPATVESASDFFESFAFFSVVSGPFLPCSFPAKIAFSVGWSAVKPRSQSAAVGGAGVPEAELAFESCGCSDADECDLAPPDGVTPPGVDVSDPGPLECAGVLVPVAPVPPPPLALNFVGMMMNGTGVSSTSVVEEEEPAGGVAGVTWIAVTPGRFDTGAVPGFVAALVAALFAVAVVNLSS